MSDIRDFSTLVLFKRPSNVSKSTMVKKSKSLLHALTVVLVEHIKMLAEIDQSLWPLIVRYLTQDKDFIR